MTKYTRANAEALLSVVTAQPNCHWLPIPSEPDSASPSPIYINDEGIFPNVTAEDELRWKPCHELPDGPGALDRAAQPGLPFPFTANELAAWMLNGAGALVAAAFGNLVEREPVENEPKDQPIRLGPDFSVLTDPDANKAREAIQAAFDIYRETVAHLKPEPKLSRTEDVIDRDEMRSEALVNHGLKTPQGAVTQGLGYRAAAEKIRLVRADVREAYQTAMVRRAVRGPDVQHAEWLSGMVQHLLWPAARPNESEQQGDRVREAVDRLRWDVSQVQAGLELLPLEPKEESQPPAQASGHPETPRINPNVDSDGLASDDREWVQIVREMALTIIARDRAKDLYPSQENIADEIARKLRDQCYVGPSGKPLSGGYIKRHGLEGISSAIHKGRSTAIKRGK